MYTFQKITLSFILCVAILSCVHTSKAQESTTRPVTSRPTTRPVSRFPIIHKKLYQNAKKAGMNEDSSRYLGLWLNYWIQTDSRICAISAEYVQLVLRSKKIDQVRLIKGCMRQGIHEDRTLQFFYRFWWTLQCAKPGTPYLKTITMRYMRVKDNKKVIKAILDTYLPFPRACPSNSSSM